MEKTNEVEVRVWKLEDGRCDEWQEAGVRDVCGSQTFFSFRQKETVTSDIDNGFLFPDAAQLFFFPLVSKTRLVGSSTTLQLTKSN